MKRFKLQAEITETVDYSSMNRVRHHKSAMEENSEGEWVRWSDVAPELAKLEDRIPEIRIERLEKKLGLVASGKCPCCGQVVRDWEAPTGSSAPEMWASLKERGIDPATGHKYCCPLGHT